MQEYLFRGKTTKKTGVKEFNCVWVEGDLIISAGKYYIHPRSNKIRVLGELGKLVVMHEVIPETVGKYIGRADCNGKQICEGDIVEFEGHGYIPEIDRGVVVFKDGCYGIEHLTDYARQFGGVKCFHRIGENSEWREMGASGTVTYTYKVIGNCYDHPELLEG